MSYWGHRNPMSALYVCVYYVWERFFTFRFDERERTQPSSIGSFVRKEWFVCRSHKRKNCKNKIFHFDFFFFLLSLSLSMFTFQWSVRKIFGKWSTVLDCIGCVSEEREIWVKKSTGDVDVVVVREMRSNVLLYEAYVRIFEVWWKCELSNR